MKRGQHKTGFTIVELLIVIVVIGILAAITVVAFNGVQQRARHASILNDIAYVDKLLRLYHAEFGAYPQTQTTPIGNNDATNPPRVDAKCVHMTTPTPTAQWVPGVTAALPQSDNNPSGGAYKHRGCYMYQSDGTLYILSAWNMLTTPQNSLHYVRIGFREGSIPAQNYICNHGNIGGNSGGTYDISEDSYKYSYTLSNITGCNQTPPAGA